MRKATRGIWIIVLASLPVVWLGASLFFMLAGCDDPPPAKDAPGEALPGAANVYTHVRELVDTLPKWNKRWNCLWAALQGKTNWAACAATAESMLAAHSNALACADRIVSASDSRWVPGMTLQKFAEDVCALQTVGLLYRVKARVEAERGDVAAGRETLLSLGRLGVRVQRLGMFPYMIGTALRGSACEAAAKPPFTLEREDDIAWLAQVRASYRAPSCGELFLEALENEREMCRAYFSESVAHYIEYVDSLMLLKLLDRCFPGYGRYACQRDICVREGLARLDWLRNKVKEGRYDRDFAMAPSPRSERSILRVFQRNWLGREKLEVYDGRGFYRIATRGRFNSIAWDVALACRCYRMRHGAWPPSLDALVPEWMAAVPTDPFDGKPLRYDTTNHYIWTKGEDGSFDGKVGFGPYGKPVWRKVKDSRWVRFLDADGCGDACQRTNHVLYVPGWMRTRACGDETWQSFTNVFAGARCELWNRWDGDCAWKKAVRNADMAARRLAHEVESMPTGVRTNVTLVGHSLGARIVVRALAELAGRDFRVRQGILLGAAIPNSDPDLQRAGKASCLPILAVCNPKDVTLKYAYGAAGGEPAPAFGTDGSPRPLENVIECPVSATVTEQTEVEAAWGKSDAIKKVASHHALFYLAALRAVLEGVEPENRQLLVPQGRINVEMKVLDAGIWWDVLETADGWKLERNRLTGHCRILDPAKKRKAWGPETTMREAFSKLRGQIR